MKLQDGKGVEDRRISWVREHKLAYLLIYLYIDLFLFFSRRKMMIAIVQTQNNRHGGIKDEARNFTPVYIYIPVVEDEV